jgi:hypothetical protein
MTPAAGCLALARVAGATVHTDIERLVWSLWPGVRHHIVSRPDSLHIRHQRCAHVRLVLEFPADAALQ